MNNFFSFVGNLTRDVELRYTANKTAVANFSIAVEEPTKDKENKITHFFDLEAWDWTAEKVATLQKGNRITVSGSVKVDSWEDKETGKKRSKVVFKAREIGLVPYVENGKDSKRSSTTKATKKETVPPSDDDDADVPF
jgi:single-strand DNA-binding protein